jgi:hypothetical protein
MCQYKLYSLWFDQIVDRNHDLPHMMRVLLTISSQERYCLLVSKYQSPYHLSVHNAFSALHMYKNVYIYSKEIRRLVITSNNAPVMK